MVSILTHLVAVYLVIWSCTEVSYTLLDVIDVYGKMEDDIEESPVM